MKKLNNRLHLYLSQVYGNLTIIFAAAEVLDPSAVSCPESNIFCSRYFIIRFHPDIWISLES